MIMQIIISDNSGEPKSAFSPRFKKLQQSPKAKFILSFLIIAVVLIATLTISWEKWGDTIVDTGREVYIPWQLSEGKVLYRDVYVNQYGPLSVYINGALFKLFGVRMMTLHIFNILLTLGVAAFLYQLFLKSSGIFVATTNCVLFFGLFAFSDITSLGIFNFVAPYAYAITYSLALAFAALHFLEKYGTSKLKRHIFTAGFVIGLVFVCKYEAFVAISICFLASILFIYPPENGWRGKIQAAGIAIAGFGLPFSGFLVFFSRFMPTQVAFESMMQQYRQIFKPQVINNPFYQLISGTLDPVVSLARIFLSIFFWGLLVLAIYLCSILFSKISNSHSRLGLGLAIGAVFFAFTIFSSLHQPVWWVTILLAGLPVFVCFGLIIFLYARCKNWKPAKPGTHNPPILFMIFSLGFIAKIALNVHAYHYGFVLAMPAFLICAWLLLHSLPRVLEARISNIFRIPTIMGSIFLLGILLSHFNLSFFSYSQKRFPIGEKNDRIVTWAQDAQNVFLHAFQTTHERGIFFKETLMELQRLLKPGDTLLVVPEGALFNYLLRRSNPTPYTSFLLGDLVMFGEFEMVRNLKRTPPTYIVLADRDLQVYGYRAFGCDTGREIMAWINSNYVLLRQIGNKPFQELGFGTQILKYSPLTISQSGRIGCTP